MALDPSTPSGRRTRRQLPVKTPLTWARPQHVIHPATMREDFLPRHPRLIPVLAINLQALHIELRIAIAACSYNIQALPTTEIDIHTKPRETRSGRSFVLSAGTSRLCSTAARSAWHRRRCSQGGLKCRCCSNSSLRCGSAGRRDLACGRSYRGKGMRSWVQFQD